MKKIVGLLIMLMMSFASFAKDIPLKVTENEWGFEISNIKSKEKKFCSGVLIQDYDFQKYEKNICIVFKSKNDDFFFDSFAEEFAESCGLAYTMNRVEFIQTKPSHVPLENIEKIYVIFTKGKFSSCSAFSDGQNLHLNISKIF